MCEPRNSDGAYPRCLFAVAAFFALGLAPQTARGWGKQSTQATPPRATSASGASNPSDPQQEPSTIAVPLPKGKKLVLTDGTFQIVREYQRLADRVRYYSLERSEWDEIPVALVDWDATQKAEAERQAEDKALVEKIRESDRAKRVADVDSDRSFEVRPGLILPDEAGLYALDGGVIQTMEQDHAEAHLDAGRAFERIATGMPLIKSKQNVDIPGKHAKIRLHSVEPEFYFRTADQRDPQITLIRADIDGGKRSLETISTDMVGQVTYKNHEYSTQEWDAAHGLYRFTVEQPLDPGEYAIVETTSEGHDMFVWDFGVDATGEDKKGAAAVRDSKKK